MEPRPVEKPPTPPDQSEQSLRAYAATLAGQFLSECPERLLAAASAAARDVEAATGQPFGPVEDYLHWLAVQAQSIIDRCRET